MRTSFTVFCCGVGNNVCTAMSVLYVSCRSTFLLLN